MNVDVRDILVLGSMWSLCPVLTQYLSYSVTHAQKDEYEYHDKLFLKRPRMGICFVDSAVE